AGNVDRVDRIGDHGVVVTDYKTGLRSPFEDITPETPDGGGEHLQLGIYGLAVGTAFNAAAIISRYWFFGHRDEPIGYTLTPEIRARFDKVLTVIADGIEQGIFPARPPETEFGRGCPYCSPDGRFVKERTSRWAVKRTDPILGPYRDLIGDLITEITDA
ncbi:MAG: PD-(D/E)XK nuclease family protein, partial [Acidimicrobiales bacterium]|nr:PD-(D/E)XK nuclease family protein [Acidimicrobiales bacterium]